MKNLFSIMVVTVLFVNCEAQKKTIPQKPKLVIVKPPQIKNKTACGNEEVNFKRSDSWYNEKYINKNSKFYDVNFSKKISFVKKVYSINNDILYYKNKKVDSLRIFYQQNENIELIVYVIKGKPRGYTINTNYNPRPSMYSVSYDQKDNISYNFIEKNIFLPKGNGILKNYYYSEWDGKSQKYSNEVLKEEGEVKNNFKFGEWKYYNKEGKIDSTKIYTLKDSVDIRFPHCLFNKNEPCY